MKNIILRFFCILICVFSLIFIMRYILKQIRCKTIKVIKPQIKHRWKYNKERYIASDVLSKPLKVFKSVWNGFKGVINTIKGIIDFFKNFNFGFLLDIIEDIGKFAVQTANQIADGVTDVANKIGAAFEAGFNAVMDFGKNIGGAVSSTVNKYFKGRNKKGDCGVRCYSPLIMKDFTGNNRVFKVITLNRHHDGNCNYYNDVRLEGGRVAFNNKCKLQHDILYENNVKITTKEHSGHYDPPKYQILNRSHHALWNLTHDEWTYIKLISPTWWKDAGTGKSLWNMRTLIQFMLINQIILAQTNNGNKMIDMLCGGKDIRNIEVFKKNVDNRNVNNIKHMVKTLRKNGNGHQWPELIQVENELNKIDNEIKREQDKIKAWVNKVSEYQAIQFINNMGNCGYPHSDITESIEKSVVENFEITSTTRTNVLSDGVYGIRTFHIQYHILDGLFLSKYENILILKKYNISSVSEFRWRFQKNNDMTYRIQPSANLNLALSFDGNKISLEILNNDITNQKWNLSFFEDGSYTIVSYQYQDKCLQMKDNSLIHIGSYNSSFILTEQKWVLISEQNLKTTWSMYNSSLLNQYNPKTKYKYLGNKSIQKNMSDSTFPSQNMEIDDAMKLCDQDINCGGVMQNVNLKKIWAKSKHIIKKYLKDNNWDDKKDKNFNFWIKRNLQREFFNIYKHNKEYFTTTKVIEISHKPVIEVSVNNINKNHELVNISNPKQTFKIRGKYEITIINSKFRTIRGSNNTYIDFPFSRYKLKKNQWTIVYVTRYAKGFQNRKFGRILTGMKTNWALGNWNDKTPVFHQQTKWIGKENFNIADKFRSFHLAAIQKTIQKAKEQKQKDTLKKLNREDFLLCIERPDHVLYRFSRPGSKWVSIGKLKNTSLSTNTPLMTEIGLSINNGFYIKETSNFNFAYLSIFDKVLQDGEVIDNLKLMLEKNYETPSTVIQTIKNKEIIDCSKLCSKNKLCNGFTYDFNNKTCILKTNDSCINKYISKENLKVFFGTSEVINPVQLQKLVIKMKSDIEDKFRHRYWDALNRMNHPRYTEWAEDWNFHLLNETIFANNPETTKWGNDDNGWLRGWNYRKKGSINPGIKKCKFPCNSSLIYKNFKDNNRYFNIIQIVEKLSKYTCKTDGSVFHPRDMPGQGRSVGTIEDCKQRCKNTHGCKYFTSYPNGGCHITNGIHGSSINNNDKPRMSGHVTCNTFSNCFFPTDIRITDISGTKENYRGGMGGTAIDKITGNISVEYKKEKKEKQEIQRIKKQGITLSVFNGCSVKLGVLHTNNFTNFSDVSNNLLIDPNKSFNCLHIFTTEEWKIINDFGSDKIIYDKNLKNMNNFLQIYFINHVILAQKTSLESDFTFEQFSKMNELINSLRKGYGFNFNFMLWISQTIKTIMNVLYDIYTTKGQNMITPPMYTIFSQVHTEIEKIKKTEQQISELIMDKSKEIGNNKNLSILQQKQEADQFKKTTYMNLFTNYINAMKKFNNTIWLNTKEGYNVLFYFFKIEGENTTKPLKKIKIRTS